MFWNKYTFSLRTQVTLYFAVLFVSIAAATTFFIGHNLYQLLIRRMDQNLEELTVRCRVDYLVGKHASFLGMEFPVYDLPGDLLTAFDQHLPGFIPVVAYEPAASDPYSSPTVFGHVDNNIYLLRLRHLRQSGHTHDVAHDNNYHLSTIVDNNIANIQFKVLCHTISLGICRE